VTVPPVDPRAPQREALRRAVLRLVMAVVLLDAVAMTIYYGAGLAHAAPRTRNVYLIGWSIATAIVVGVLLRRVRKVRWEGRSG
jgi:hypothetical protein